MIRFYGTERSLPRWREIVAETTGKECTPIKARKTKSIVRHTFDADLTAADRQSLMAHWYAETGIEGATDAQGRPLAWNCCIAFKQV